MYTSVLILTTWTWHAYIFTITSNGRPISVILMPSSYNSVTMEGHISSTFVFKAHTFSIHLTKIPKTRLKHFKMLFVCISASSNTSCPWIVFCPSHHFSLKLHPAICFKLLYTNQIKTKFLASLMIYCINVPCCLPGYLIVREGEYMYCEGYLSFPFHFHREKSLSMVTYSRFNTIHQI